MASILKKVSIAAICLCLVTAGLSAQEALLSDMEQYYDFLALEGETERPTLNYRTLSDSVWSIKDGIVNPWQSHIPGIHPLFGDITMKIYGPELFMSYNTAAPYGQNDGALWQGKGFNTSLTGGIRLEGYGIELTLKPQLAFSQNLPFAYVKPAYDNTNPLYTDRAGIYGYYGIPSIDAPQRFGDKAFFSFDWGDSEIRYTWKTVTIGFGTQPIWLGPAKINPVLLSNNAASYPKLDIGLRKQRIELFGIYFGDIEARVFWGRLEESDFFDNDNSNNANLLTGLSVAYAVPFLSGFTLGVNRIMLSKWNSMNAQSIFTLLWPFMDIGAGKDENDQRASFTIDYIFPQVGFEVYLEWGRNDFSPSMDYIIRYPFHTQGYTFGARKSVTVSEKYNLYGEILLEITNLESSRDYDNLIPWHTTFYAHHIITQGHTNKGQWLGAGMGTGGNSQYLGFKLYYPKGFANIFIQRVNPDNDYTWFIKKSEHGIRADLSFGISSVFFITDKLKLSGVFVFTDSHNPLYEPPNVSMRSNHRYNCHIELGVLYQF